MSVYDRWHLRHPPPGVKKCGTHRKAPSAAHGRGLQWQVRGTDQDGNPYRQNFEYEQDAVDKDAELRTAVRAGTFVDERAGQVTLQAYAEAWARTRVHNPSTRDRIRSSFECHVYEDPDGPRGRTRKGGAAIGQHPMRTLARRVSIAQGWISGIPLHANSAIQLIKDVGQVFSAAVDDKIIHESPLGAKSVQWPDPVAYEAQAWTLERIELVASHLPERMQAMPFLGANCGHRQGELSATALDDLDFLRKACHVGCQVKYVDLTGVPDVTRPARAVPLSGRQLVFAPSKNGKERDVPVADEVILKLSASLAAFPAVPVTLPFLRKDGKLDGGLTRELVFTSEDGRPWYRGTVHRPWTSAWRAAGVPVVAQANGWHVLRHTAASEWLSKGLSLAKVAAYLGDTQAVVLDTYSHFMPDDEERSREIMNAFFGARKSRKNAPDKPAALGSATLWQVRGCLQHFREK